MVYQEMFVANADGCQVM